MSEEVESPERTYGGKAFHEWDLLFPGSLLAKGPGRPRHDDEAERVDQLRREGTSWRLVTTILNKERGLTLTKDAYRNLYKSRKGDGLYQVFLQRIRELQPRKLRLTRRRRGRPRKDHIRLDAAQMRHDGYTWRKIARSVNQKYSQKLVPDAYRKLCGSFRAVPPWRKLDPNSFRGK